LIHFVSGNRSGDLDSLVSSYVLSVLLKEKNRNEDEIFPVRYFPEEKWKLHRDALFLFKECGAEVERFLFVNDAVNHLEKHRGSLLYLTDHNQPEEELSSFSSDIAEIWDHHVVSTPLPANAAIHIATTGSCSTLIAEKLLLLSKDPDTHLTPELICSLSEMLYFTIRMDTDHLTDKKQYDLDRDYSLLKQLKSLIGKDESFFEALKAKKYNFDDFSLEDHLERDYKFWSKKNYSYGISTIHLPVEDFFSLLSESPEQIDDFIKKRDLSILFLMHFNKEPILKRELTVICPGDTSFSQKVEKALKGSPLFEQIKKEERVFRYFQKNPRLSRKKIQPVLDGLLSKIIEEA
jgi:inorganic pyrophosphatase/exopolyphosphatase